MRTLCLSITLAAIAAPAAAQEIAGRAEPLQVRPPVVDCKRPGVTHAQRPAPSSRPQRLAELPDAWRLNAVIREVGPCQVHPEARKISSRTGQPLAASPSRR